MPLSIKNDVTERLARQVAEETGETLTTAIQTALKERLQRLKTIRQSHGTTAQIEDLLRRVDTLSTLDGRSAEEILGYDENGMPR